MDLIKYHYFEQLKIGFLKLNRPEKHNSLTDELLLQLKDKLKQLQKDKDVRLLILRGEGEKAFSSGVDLKFLLDLKGIEENRNFAQLMEETALTLYNFPKPTIAVINGYAFGGGFGLAAACDYRIMSQTAVVGFPAVKLGAIMPVTCTYFVSTIIGFHQTKKLMLTGKQLTAEEALRIGLVDEVVAPVDIDERATEVAKQILEGTDLALNLTKKTINTLAIKELKAFSLYAIDNFAYLSQTEDWRKRMENFLKNKK